MSDTRVDVSDEIKQVISSACYDHLVFTMKNKGLFLQPMNFSTVQYMNERCHYSAYKFNAMLARKLKDSFGADKSYLNMGTTVGWLPWASREDGSDLRIDNVEWDDQLECCEALRNTFGININYTCNNVNDENFVIRDINEVYDYVVLQRFFPIYHTHTGDQMLNILRKFKPYAKKSLVIEADNNWTDGVFDVLKSVSEKRIIVSGQWQMTVTDLEKL